MPWVADVAVTFVWHMGHCYMDYLAHGHPSAQTTSSDLDHLLLGQAGLCGGITVYVEGCPCYKWVI